MSVYPTNLTSDRLPMPLRIHRIPLRTTDLVVYRTPDLARLMQGSKLMFLIIFIVSRAVGGKAIVFFTF
jgi:hypothetical protein